MLELDEDLNVISWTTSHGIHIPYEYNGKIKNYIPDFLILMKSDEKILEEVKGWIRDQEQHNSKIKFATEWSQRNGYTYTINYMR